MNNKKLWYPAAMVLALSVTAGAAHAKSLEQVGVGAGRIEPLETYGVDVSVKSGLKTLLPSGWNLYIYKNTSLPQGISWKVGDTWVSALETFADKSQLAVRIDWARKAVYISTPEVAMEARARLAEIGNAAKTPLPSYAPAVVAAAGVSAATTAAAATSPAVTREQTATPVALAPSAQEGKPSSSEVLAKALAATAPVKPTSTAAPQKPTDAGGPAPVAKVDGAAVAVAAAVTPGSDAFAHGDLEDVIRAAAAKVGYLVSWETVTLPVSGPVTVLGVDAAEDMLLIQKSLGMRQSPVAIEVYRGSQVVRVMPNSPGKEPFKVSDTPYQGLLAANSPRSINPVAEIKKREVAAPIAPPSLPIAAVVQVTAPKIADRSPAATPAKAAAPVPVELTFKVARGESLSKAVAQFLKAQGWEVKWQVPNDLEADFPFEAKGANVADVLRELLPKLGLKTDLYTPSKMVVIRPTNPIAD